MKEKVPPPCRARVRDTKRGGRAWAHAQAAEKLDLGSLGSRLLSHAVADRTAIQSYLPAVERWLNFVEKHQPLHDVGRTGLRAAGL